MEKLAFVACIITVIFSMIKVIEMKYINKEWTPLKYIIRDAFIVFSASFFGLFCFLQINGSLTDFMNIVTDNSDMNLKATQVFTDSPGF